MVNDIIKQKTLDKLYSLFSAYVKVHRNYYLRKIKQAAVIAIIQKNEMYE